MPATLRGDFRYDAPLPRNARIMSPSDSTPLLRTKLRRPPVPPDVVRREELHARLDAALQFHP